ncbi:unnamed protein product, partial [Prorocentrum cordatum]
DITRDVSDFSDLLAKRPDSEELPKNLSASLCTRIQSFTALSAPDAIVLTELIEKKCTVASVKRAVLAAVDIKVANIAAAVPSSISDAGDQTLSHIYNYLTGKDWMALEDYRAPETKKMKFIDLHAFLGKHIPLRDNNILLKKERAGCWQSSDFTPLQQDRHGGWHSSWGGNSDLDKLAAQIHGLYTAGQSGASSAHAPAASFKPGKSIVAGAAPAADAARAAEPKVAALPLGDGEAAPADGDAAPAAGDAAPTAAGAALAADRVAQGAREKQAFDALATKGKRTAKERPAAATDVAKKPAAAKKRPAAATGVAPALKKPAAASWASKGGAFKIVFEPCGGQCTQNAVASRWCGRALKWAKANGRTEKQALDDAKDAY